LPLTPFHFGPGLFIKGLVSRRFSWLAFIASQIVIDLETLYYLSQGKHPVHRFFHTFLGATIAGLLTGAILVGTRHMLEVRSPSLLLGFMKTLRPSLKAELSNIGLLVGAVVGGLSHPLLDGIMHRDIRPFAPWTEKNPLLQLIDLEALHLGCVFLGIIGFLFMTIRLYREASANKSLTQSVKWKS
jgi:membrane-bound metal-dependent hydrolase YbcI (DUF457 family)